MLDRVCNGGLQVAKRKVSEVFKTVGLPAYTYVRPRHYGEIRSDIETQGKHILIEGPSGIGKSCVVFAVFQDLGWTDGVEYKYVSCRDTLSGSDLLDYIESSILGKAPYPILVADDFHMIGEDLRREIGSRLKRLSDKTFSSAQVGKVVLIGIPAAGTSILSNSHDLGPRLGSYRFKTATDSEISKLIAEGENQLNIIFENQDAILSEASGNFWLAQYICSKICSTNEIFEEYGETEIVDFNMIDIRQRLMAELNNNFMGIATTFAKGKKWRPGGNKPYLEILMSVRRIPDLVVPFDNVLSTVPERRRPGLKAVKPRIKDVIHNPTKGIDLRRQIAFEEDYFSLEDPLFRYFLTNMDEEQFYKELGLKKDLIDEDNKYGFEIGFSFAGEVRNFVEHINNAFKDEDSTTFYDFDQQAILLAEDLEQVLPRIYSESCRYYLVFIEKHYIEKVWTRFERDILTRSGRSKHIIPVILDSNYQGRVVGIPSTIGMVDLTAEWEEIVTGTAISGEIAERIKSKLVQPVVEKASSRHMDL